MRGTGGSRWGGLLMLIWRVTLESDSCVFPLWHWLVIVRTILKWSIQRVGSKKRCWIPRRNPFQDFLLVCLKNHYDFICFPNIKGKEEPLAFSPWGLPRLKSRNDPCTIGCFENKPLIEALITLLLVFGRLPCHDKKILKNY